RVEQEPFFIFHNIPIAAVNGYWRLYPRSAVIEEKTVQQEYNLNRAHFDPRQAERFAPDQDTDVDNLPDVSMQPTYTAFPVAIVTLTTILLAMAVPNYLSFDELQSVLLQAASAIEEVSLEPLIIGGHRYLQMSRGDIDVLLRVIGQNGKHRKTIIK